MVSKTHIFKELKKIQSLYIGSASEKDGADLQKFYSKLALIECCGWIEQSMDYLVLKPEKKIKSERIRNLYIRLVKRNSSFDYHSFSKMMMSAYGVALFEKIEKKVDQQKLDVMISTLGTLEEARNPHAHTSIQGTMKTFQAPSVILKLFSSVYEGLKEFEEQIKKTI